MTIQEQIRIETAISLKACFLNNSYEVAQEDWKTYHKEGKECYLRQADALLRRQKSKGVVIKVDRELPREYNSSSEELRKAGVYQRHMLEAGYVAVEPLIEEVLNEQCRGTRLLQTA